MLCEDIDSPFFLEFQAAAAPKGPEMTEAVLQACDAQPVLTARWHQWRVPPANQHHQHATVYFGSI